MRRSPLAALFDRFGATTVVQNTTIVAPNGQGRRVMDRWSCGDGVGPTAFPIRRRVEGSGLGSGPSCVCISDGEETSPPERGDAGLSAGTHTMSRPTGEAGSIEVGGSGGASAPRTPADYAGAGA